jgi:hypothetical protein
LKNNAQKIAEWLKDYSPKKKMTLEFIHKNPIGGGIPKGKTSLIDGLIKSRVVLEKDVSLELGFKVLTAFQIIK